MNRCRARLPLGRKPLVRPGPFGFPETLQVYCGQTVGVQQVGAFFACAIPGHRADVERQETEQRVRHEMPLVRLEVTR